LARVEDRRIDTAVHDVHLQSATLVRRPPPATRTMIFADWKREDRHDKSRGIDLERIEQYRRRTLQIPEPCDT
jgi:hypothetical protein